MLELIYIYRYIVNRTRHYLDVFFGTLWYLVNRTRTYLDHMYLGTLWHMSSMALFNAKVERSPSLLVGWLVVGCWNPASGGQKSSFGIIGVAAMTFWNKQVDLWMWKDDPSICTKIRGVTFHTQTRSDIRFLNFLIRNTFENTFANLYILII